MVTPTPDAFIHWTKRHPQTVAFLSKLNNQGIDWGLYCGTTAQLLTGNRQSNDVDIVIRNSDFQTVRELAPANATIHQDDTATVTCGDGLTLNFPKHSICFWLDGQEIEIIASTTASSDNHQYHVAMSDLAIQNRLMFEVGKTQLYVINPFDTMALKAILQRGYSMRKHDATDIASLGKHYSPSTIYALRRTREMQLDDRALDFLAMCNIELASTPVQTTPSRGILHAY
jgi:hypothetical protein